ncbi:MAG: DMT family transporter [Peptococcaceae bacterium]|nr:DMT family transporter [Peptococcaceae bacterium]
MGAKFLALLTAALSGMTMAVQGTVNTSLSKVIGLMEATFVVHLVGLVFVSVLLFIFKMGQLRPELFSQVPLYGYLGGILGVVIVYLVIKSIPRVGVAPATTAIILGQVFTAGLIDHLGLFGMEKMPFNWCRVGGTLLMAGGAWLILRR